MKWSSKWSAPVLRRLPQIAKLIEALPQLRTASSDQDVRKQDPAPISYPHSSAQSSLAPQSKTPHPTAPLEPAQKKSHKTPFQTDPFTDPREEIPFQQVASCGSNPGNLRMFQMVPHDLPRGAPLVVLLHGCGQNAGQFGHGTGWSHLARQENFALLAPEQHFTNNPTKCFNWFKQADSIRESGEALSIAQMIEHLSTGHGIDRSRIFITGLSAGGAMSTAMLASYPEIFAAGAVVAGLPYGAASHMGQAIAAMMGAKSNSIDGWRQKISSNSHHAGPWPRLSIWHGSNDRTVSPDNAWALEKQWRGLHDLGDDALTQSVQAGATYRSWHNRSGIKLLETIMVNNMDHGVPIDMVGASGMTSGTSGKYFLDVGISSTHHIAKFWGLLAP